MKRRSKGSILILVLWVVAFLALFGLSVGHSVRQFLHVARTMESRDQLRNIADSAVRKALYLMSRQSANESKVDSLNEFWNRSSHSFKNIPVGLGFFDVGYMQEDKTNYGLIDEERKININQIKNQRVLTSLFRYAASISKDEAQAIAASVLDWRDADNHLNLDGAEDRFYQNQSPGYLPKNANFSTLEELLLVKGVTPGIYKKVLPHITLVGSGSVNLNTADQVVLRAIGFGDSLISKVMAFRLGRDGKPGTYDDGVFESLNGAMELLNDAYPMDDNDKSAFTTHLLSGSLRVSSEHFAIHAICHLNHRREWLQVNSIIQRYGSIVSWRETFGVGETPF